jgi:hypothetical protein
MSALARRGALSGSSSVAAARPHFARAMDERFASQAAASLAGSDASLIGERAATRGRSAEGGDEHGGAKSGHPFELQLRARTNGDFLLPAASAL